MDDHEPFIENNSAIQKQKILEKRFLTKNLQVTKLARKDSILPLRYKSLGDVYFPKLLFLIYTSWLCFACGW